MILHIWYNAGMTKTKKVSMKPKKAGKGKVC